LGEVRDQIENTAGFALDVASVHDWVLAPAPRAPSPEILAFDATMRGESDRIRRRQAACSRRSQTVASNANADASWQSS
jgi:hypothetical protein